MTVDEHRAALMALHDEAGALLVKIRAERAEVAKILPNRKARQLSAFHYSVLEMRCAFHQLYAATELGKLVRMG